MKTKLTSHDLLAASGITAEAKPVIPDDYRHLMITSIINFVPVKKLQVALNNAGCEASLREVLAWQKATREWLGLPSPGRGKPTKELRKAIQYWLDAHGNPTLDEIDDGWVPAFTINSTQHDSKNSMRDYPKMLKEFRSQLACLLAAIDDDEVKRLLDTYLRRCDGIGNRICSIDESSETIA